MNSLEKIKLAYSYGWGAIIEIGGVESQVVMVAKRVPAIAYKTPMENIIAFPESGFTDVKIIGYKFMGELGGSEPIPETQKFKVRENGKIVYLRKGEDDFYCRTFTDTLEGCPDISAMNHEIEPYFD